MATRPESSPTRAWIVVRGAGINISELRMVWGLSKSQVYRALAEEVIEDTDRLKGLAKLAADRGVWKGRSVRDVVVFLLGLSDIDLTPTDSGIPGSPLKPAVAA